MNSTPFPPGWDEDETEGSVDPFAFAAGDHDQQPKRKRLAKPVRQEKPRSRHGNAVPGCLVISLLLVVLFVVVSSNSRNRPPQPTEPPSSPEKQSKRESFIEQMQAADLIGEVASHGMICRVEVKPEFYLLDFKDKQSFVSVIYGWTFDNRKGGMIFLEDIKTGKRVGSFSSSRGLRLD